VEILGPYLHLDIPRIGQTYIIFRGRLAAPFTFGPGPETLETALFAPGDIPFDELAFSSVRVALENYVKDTREGKGYPFRHGVIEKRGGPSADYSLRDVMVVGGEAKL
jgi:ADP-ribose/FAD diphosphatase